MKSRFLIIIAFTAFISVWGIDFPTRPRLAKGHLRTEEELTSYTYSLADTLTFEFQDKYLAEYSYQANKLEMVSVKELIDSSWLEIEKYLYQYADERITQELYQIYDSAWYNYQKKSYEYNQNGLITDYQLDNWSNSSWTPYLHIEYIYDTEGVLINEEWTYYTDREVALTYNLTYQYDSQERVVGEIWTSSTDNINWTNYLKGLYTLNDNSSIINEDWQTWVDTEWLSYLQYNHTFNSFNKIAYTEGVAFLDNQWQYYDNYSYLYNANQNVQQIIGKLWNSQTANWVNSYKYAYEYQELVTNSDNDALAHNLQVSLYPNPFNDEVKYDSEEQLNKVSVYNLKGQKLYSNSLNKSKGSLSLKTINEYPSGIYFFRFEDSQGNVSVSKQVKLK